MEDTQEAPLTLSLKAVSWLYDFEPVGYRCPKVFMELVYAVPASCDKSVPCAAKPLEELHGKAWELSDWANFGPPGACKSWEEMFDEGMADFKEPSGNPEEVRLVAMCAAARYTASIAHNPLAEKRRREVDLALEERGFKPESCPVCYPPPPPPK